MKYLLLSIQQNILKNCKFFFDSYAKSTISKRGFLALLSLSFVFTILIQSCSRDDNSNTTNLDFPSIEDGWTVFEESSDTRKIYVSNSQGDDANDGLSPESPKKTVEAGMALLRDNMPDWLLFKKGDEWPKFGAWRHSGRSSEEMMLISSYGDGAERPKFGEGITVSGAGSTPEIIQNVAFVGLAIVPEQRNPANPIDTKDVTGMRWLRGARNVLFEGMFFRWVALALQDFDGFGIDNVTFRRTHILDSYSVTGHAQGIFVSGATNVSFEECILDHNGWAAELPDARPTKFNHNIYYQYGSDETFTVKNSILARGSSHGMQLRSGGFVENNLFMQNAINILIGNSNNVGGTTGWVIDNVILDATDIRPREGHTSDPALRGWALGLNNIKNITITGNIAANSLGGFSQGLMRSTIGGIDGPDPNVTISENITIGYGSNEDHDHTGPFVDANRNISTYMQHIGLNGGIEEFMLEVRKQQRGNWRKEFTAAFVNDYIREGFRTP